jgi:hypothetical protein
VLCGAEFTIVLMGSAMSGTLRVGFLFVVGTGVLIVILLSWVMFVGPLAQQLLVGVGPTKQADRLATCVSEDSAMPDKSDANSAAMRRYSSDREGEMEIVYGRIREVLPASDGEISGFVIDGGLEVHFPKGSARQVAALVPLGSRLEICGDPYRGVSGDPHINAKFITNLDSKRSVNLQNSPPPKEPEMSSLCAPTFAEAASLAPRQRKGTDDAENSLRRETSTSVAAERSSQTYIQPANLISHPPVKDPLGSMGGRVRTDEDGAARSIELAYDGLHRAQALLAYVKIVDLQAPDVSQMCEESRHTYQQAVSSYQKQDYAVASEFAAASGELSRSLEVVVSGILRVDSSYPTLVPYPPGNQSAVTSSSETDVSLNRVRKLLARIHWLANNGTLPSEDRAQVRKIASWSDMFYAKGRQAFQTGAIIEASYFINAAEALAHSAEHVCKQDYIAHASATN